MTSKTILKSWFSRGAKPTASQFAEWIDSYRHLTDKISISDIENMSQHLSGFAQKNAVVQHLPVAVEELVFSNKLFSAKTGAMDVRLNIHNIIVPAYIQWVRNTNKIDFWVWGIFTIDKNAITYDTGSQPSLALIVSGANDSTTITLLTSFVTNNVLSQIISLIRADIADNNNFVELACVAPTFEYYDELPNQGAAGQVIFSIKNEMIQKYAYNGEAWIEVPNVDGDPFIIDNYLSFLDKTKTENGGESYYPVGSLCYSIADNKIYRQNDDYGILDKNTGIIPASDKIYRTPDALYAYDGTTLVRVAVLQHKTTIVETGIKTGTTQYTNTFRVNSLFDMTLLKPGIASAVSSSSYLYIDNVEEMQNGQQFIVQIRPYYVGNITFTLPTSSTDGVTIDNGGTNNTIATSSNGSPKMLTYKLCILDRVKTLYLTSIF